MIFRKQFNRDMGLKYPGVLGFSIFGAKVIKEELILSRLIFPAWKSLINLLTFGAMMDQFFLTNSLLKPSGPGEFSFGKCLTTSSISLSEKVLAE
jgi:hypothetical protein